MYFLGLSYLNGSRTKTELYRNELIAFCETSGINSTNFSGFIVNHSHQNEQLTENAGSLESH